MNIRNKHIIVFIIFIILGSLLSIEHGQGAEWDTLNYHLYLPWAFLNNRLDIDFCPCGIHSYFNPVGMVPYYLLVKYFNQYPIFVAAIQGWVWSILAFLTYLISFEIIRVKNEGKRIALSLISAIVGSSVMSIYMQIGLGSTGLSSFIPMLLAFYLLVKNTLSNKYLFFASFLIGVSFGLKLTNGIYFVSVFLSLCLYFFFQEKLSFSQIIKKSIIYLLGALIGFLIIDGYFLYVLYMKFKNPVFPLYNNIFKSDLYTPVLYKDYRFMPDHIAEYLFLPFYNVCQYINSPETFNLYPSYIVTHSPVYDISFCLQYISAFVLLFIKKIPIFKNKELTFVDFQKFLLFVYMYIFSYFIWNAQFSILSYFFGALIFAGLFLVVLYLLFSEVTSKHKLVTIIFAVILITIFATKYTYYNHPRANFASKVIFVPHLKFKNNSVVVLTSKLSSYIALTQNKKVRYVGYDIPADGNKELVPTEKYYEKAFSIMNEASKVYVIKTSLTTEGAIEQINENLKPELKLKGTCKYFSTNLSNHFNEDDDRYNLYLCE